MVPARRGSTSACDILRGHKLLALLSVQDDTKGSGQSDLPLPPKNMRCACKNWKHVVAILWSEN